MSFDYETKKDLGTNIISSRVVKNENQPMRVKKPRYLLTSDNFRAIVQRISPDSENFTPDTFQVLKWWMVNNLVSTKEVREVLTSLKISDTLEFRIGTYTLSALWEKKKKF